MAAYRDIIGHQDTIDHLKSAMQTGKVSHAYLMEGARGSGKMMMAEAFAAALMCENGGAEACGSCAACRRTSTRSHPDVHYITHEKPGLISVDEVRRQLSTDVQIRPYEARYKVYIMEDAHLMNVMAQNALLKTLEEPPAYVVILLLTPNGESLLETIRSRVVTLPLRSIKDSDIEQFLMEKKGLPDYQARLCAAFAQGSVGRGIELALSENFQEIRSLVIGLARRAKDMDVSQLIAYIREVSKFKLDIGDYLDLLRIWYRDVLYFKATQDPGRLVFRDELRQIRSNASCTSYEGLEDILKALDTARVRLEANVNFDLTMELLLLTIKENS